MARKPKSDPHAPRTAEGAVASRRPASAGTEPEQPSFALAEHRKRSARAWTTRSLWQGLYDDAYEYAVPYRRPSARTGPASNRVNRLFDNTAIVSTFRFAGQLQNDLFPPGQPFFKLAPGPMAAVLLADTDKVELARRLEDVSKTVQGLFLSSEWDTAVHETCIDLAVGTGCLLVVEGDDDRPVRFCNVPADEVAIEPGPYNDLALIAWRTRWTRRQIRAAFPKGDFCKKFQDGDNSRADEEVEFNQDFVLEGKRWRFVADFVEKLVGGRDRSAGGASPRSRAGCPLPVKPGSAAGPG